MVNNCSMLRPDTCHCTTDFNVKSVALITGVAFWRRGDGTATRTYELCRYLNRHARLTIIYFGRPISDTDLEKIRPVSESFELVQTGDGTMHEFYRAVERTVLARHLDVCIVDRVTNAWVISLLRKETLRILDTHDLMSSHLNSARRYGVDSSLDPAFMHLSLQKEIRLLAKFDVVIFIQKREHDLASSALGRDRCIIVPHPAILEKRELRSSVRHIGLAASSWVTNVEGINWFASEIWPIVRRPETSFDIYGTVCETIEPGTIEQCTLHGFVDDLSVVYDQLDLVINPARAGSGLKIKNVEALGRGLPLVTTPEGASGLEELAGRGFLVAETAQQFADHLQLLMADHSLRLQLGEAAFEFAAEHLSPDRCFAPLLQVI
jgi:hypothetical protein